MSGALHIWNDATGSLKTEEGIHMLVMCNVQPEYFFLIAYLYTVILFLFKKVELPENKV